MCILQTFLNPTKLHVKIELSSVKRSLSTMKVVSLSTELPLLFKTSPKMLNFCLDTRVVHLLYRTIDSIHADIVIREVVQLGRECHGFVNLCGRRPWGWEGAGMDFLSLGHPVPVARAWRVYTTLYWEIAGFFLEYNPI
jgi:hypothetical protein